MEQNVIRLNKARSFTDMLSAVFDVLRQIARPLFRILLVTAGPFVALGALLMGLGSVNTLRLWQTLSLEPALSTDVAMSGMLQNVTYLLFGIPVYAVSFMVILVVCQSYVITYQQLGRIPTDAEAREGRAGAWKSALQLFGLAYLAFLICIAVIVSPALVSQYLLIVSVPLGTVCVIWGTVPFWIAFAASRADMLPVMQSIRYAWELVKGNWWFCYGAIVVVGIIQWIIGRVVTILELAAMLVLMTSGVENGISSDAGRYVVAVGSGLGFFFSAFLGVMLHVTAVVTYYVLVERKEARSLSGVIDQLGQQ